MGREREREKERSWMREKGDGGKYSKAMVAVLYL
jgi:hypothetical protein